MQVPQMTKIQAHFEDSNLEIDLQKDENGHYLNEVARYAFMNWMTAYSLGREHQVKIANKAIEIALAEQSQEQPLISAEEARKLEESGGKAEYYMPEAGYWHGCGVLEKFPERFADGEKIKYRAIKQLEPVEPHAELRAMYEQQAKNTTDGKAGGLEDFDWELLTIKGEWENVGTPVFASDCAYRCTPKPTYQVRNLDTGELKTMTREAAREFACDNVGDIKWTQGGVLLNDIPAFDATVDVPYTYKLKALNQISWKDVPVGVMLRVKTIGAIVEFRSFNRLTDGIRTESIDGHGRSMTNERTSEAFELAPADQQDYLNWRGGECPVPEGVMVEVTQRNGNKHIAEGVTFEHWKHRTPDDEFNFPRDIIEYRIAGIAKGYSL